MQLPTVPTWNASATRLPARLLCTGGCGVQPGLTETAGSAGLSNDKEKGSKGCERSRRANLERPEAFADPKGPGLRGEPLHWARSLASPVSKLVEAVEMPTFRTRSMDREDRPFLRDSYRTSRILP